MFIRASSQRDKKTKRVYTTYRLVQSYRNQDGKTRQRTLVNLGCHFSAPKEQWKLIADRVEEITRGQTSLLTLDDAVEKEAQQIAKLVVKLNAEQPSTSVDKTNTTTDYQRVDLNSLAHQNIRKIGAEHVAYHAAKQLQLEKILRSVGFNEKQIKTALGTIIGRLVHPGSELKTHRYLTEQSALDELLETDFSRLPLKNLYKISDQLLNQKTVIEDALYQSEKDLFNFEETVTLYDITNTYFEGRCLLNAKAQYGRSKEKRYDCCLVALGIVLDASGFPKKSSIFPGNVSEPKTLEEMITSLGADKKSTIVMDAGFATEANIEWLQRSDYKYIVVSRKRTLTMPENVEKIMVKDERHNLVEASLVENDETDEMELYCHSQAKEEKTNQMRSKASTRYETELQKLASGLTKKGCTKKYDNVIEKLGRLKERYKKVGQSYEVTVTRDEAHENASQLQWKKINEGETQAGVYCLRTNRKDLDETTLWTIYTTLTDLEAAFRSLKSELGLRPVYHQKEERVDGHLFISILAYHLLHTIRYQLKMRGINDSWETIRDVLETHCRITSTLKLEDGRVVNIRKTSSPDTNQAAIYKVLGISAQPCKTEKGYF